MKAFEEAVDEGEDQEVEFILNDLSADYKKKLRKKRAIPKCIRESTCKEVKDGHVELEGVREPGDTRPAFCVLRSNSSMIFWMHQLIHFYYRKIGLEFNNVN